MSRLARVGGLGRLREVLRHLISWAACANAGNAFRSGQTIRDRNFLCVKN